MQSRPTPSSTRRPISRRRSPAAALAQAVEGLEGRTLFNSTPFVLSSGPLSQNWENADLITTTDDWSNVPSFAGFRGDDIAFSSSDPRTAVTDGTVRSNVLANQTTAPGSVSAGGVAEFTLSAAIPSATPNTGSNTIALQGSGTADAPHLIAYLDTTNVSALRAKFDVIDIDAGSATNDATAAQPFVLQYRVGSSGNWTNVDSTYTAAAAPAGPGIAGNVTSFDVLLPSALAGQSLVQLRWLTVNVGGNDQYIAIDNINISAEAGTNPGTFSIDPASVTQNVLEDVGTVNVVVKRANGFSGAVTLPYTLGGTATAGSDYTAPSGTLTFADGADTATISIPVIDDASAEAAETITITLGTPSSGSLGANTGATITVADNDSGGTLALNPSTYSVNESDGTVTLTVTRTNGSTGAAGVNYTLIAGTATAGSDYVAANGTVSFAAGETSKTFTVSILGDSVTEVDETFTVSLSNPTGGGVLLGNSTATVTIIDDDGVLPTGLILHEMNMDPPGTNEFDYIELRGTPGQILRDVYILLIEGDANANGDAGRVDKVINLTNAVIGSNGLLLVRAATGFTPEDAATGVFTTNLINNGFETNSLSAILFYADKHLEVPAVPAVGVDLDLDEDVSENHIGTLEGLSTAYNYLDAVAVFDLALSSSVNADIGYSGPVGVPAPAVVASTATLSSSAPDYVGRIESNSTPYDTNAWFGANYPTSGATSSTKTFASTSPNAPTNARSTPGGFLNVVATPTTISGVALNATVTGPQTLSVTFNQNVGASLAASDFVLTNNTTGATINLTLSSVSADGKTALLTFSGVTGTTAGPKVLSSGNYTLRALGGQIDNLASDATATFFFQTADFDRDRDVDFADLLTLAKNYNKTGMSFAQGDADYDGDVDFADLLTLAKNYNKTLAPPPAATVASVTPTRTRTSFGATIIA